MADNFTSGPRINCHSCNKFLKTKRTFILMYRLKLQVSGLDDAE